MHGSISTGNVSFSRNSDVKTHNAKNVTWVLFIFKDKDTLVIAFYSLLPFPTMDFIPGQLISLTNSIHKISGQFVNKPGKRLFCDKAPLNGFCDNKGGSKII